jgi:hypothetical protein
VWQASFATDLNLSMKTSAANQCHQCGATSYQPVIKRDDQGVMRPSGEFRCTGCRLIFKSIDEWRADKQMPAAPKAPNAETRTAMVEADEIARAHSERINND